jgi:hypothetical protein
MAAAACICCICWSCSCWIRCCCRESAPAGGASVAWGVLAAAPAALAGCGGGIAGGAAVDAALSVRPAPPNAPFPPPPTPPLPPRVKVPSRRGPACSEPSRTGGPEAALASRRGGRPAMGGAGAVAGGAPHAATAGWAAGPPLPSLASPPGRGSCCGDAWPTGACMVIAIVDCGAGVSLVPGGGPPGGGLLAAQAAGGDAAADRSIAAAKPELPHASGRSATLFIIETSWEPLHGV